MAPKKSQRKAPLEMSPQQRREILQRFEGLIPNGITFEQAHRLLHDATFWESVGMEVRSRLDVLAAAPAKVVYPALNAVFQLGFDPAALGSDPREFVEQIAGYSPESFVFLGEPLREACSAQFELVSTQKDCDGIEAVRAALGGDERIPLSQWLAPFRLAYPHHSGGPIGIADPRWANRSRHPCVPYIDERGAVHFIRTDRRFDKSWRWIVLAM